MKILTDTGLMVLWNKIKQLVLGNRPYNPSEFSGKGYKVLEKNIQTVGGVKKNILTSVMINQPNTIYVIRYDFNLGEDITVPANCVLEFDGGCINGQHTITGNNTQIKAQDVVILNNGINIAGTWICHRITSKWFGDLSIVNRVKQIFNLQNKTIVNKIIIEQGEYHVTVSNEYESAIKLYSNTHLILLGSIIMNSVNVGNYNIIEVASVVENYNMDDIEPTIIEKVSNVIIEGSGSLIGEKDTHTGTFGEWGMGINLFYCYDTIVRGVTIKNTWGDGIYITGIVNTIIQNCIIDDCRRNGIVITSANNLIIENNLISNIKGTAPKAAICLEPNFNQEVSRNVIIKNNKCIDNGMGIDIVPYRANLFNIKIFNNHVTHSENTGDCALSLYSRENVTISSYHGENIEVCNNYFEGYRRQFICQYNKNVIVKNNIFKLGSFTLSEGENINDFISTFLFINDLVFFNNIHDTPLPIKFSDTEKTIVSNSYFNHLGHSDAKGEEAIYFGGSEYANIAELKNNSVVGRATFGASGPTIKIEGNVFDLNNIESSYAIYLQKSNCSFRDNKIVQTNWNRFTSCIQVPSEGNYNEISHNKFVVPTEATESSYIVLNSNYNHVGINDFSTQLTTNIMNNGSHNLIDIVP